MREAPQVMTRTPTVLRDYPRDSLRPPLGFSIAPYVLHDPAFRDTLPKAKNLHWPGLHLRTKTHHPSLTTAHVGKGPIITVSSAEPMDEKEDLECPSEQHQQQSNCGFHEEIVKDLSKQDQEELARLSYLLKAHTDSGERKAGRNRVSRTLGSQTQDLLAKRTLPSTQVSRNSVMTATDNNSTKRVSKTRVQHYPVRIIRYGKEYDPTRPRQHYVKNKTGGHITTYSLKKFFQTTAKPDTAPSPTFSSLFTNNDPLPA